MRRQFNFTNQRMKCDICSQYTGSYRYGGRACAACANFFRRQILNPKNSYCKYNGDCGMLSEELILILI